MHTAAVRPAGAILAGLLLLRCIYALQPDADVIYLHVASFCLCMSLWLYRHPYGGFLGKSPYHEGVPINSSGPACDWDVVSPAKYVLQASKDEQTSKSDQERRESVWTAGEYWCFACAKQRGKASQPSTT